MFDDPEQLREAESLYRAAISQNPGKASLHNSLGSILRALGRLGEAAVEFHEAIRTSPDEAAARTAHQHAIALNPGNAKAYLDLGNVLMRFGEDREAAADEYIASIEMADGIPLLIEIAESLVEADWHGLADDAYQKAIETEDGSHEERVSLGHSLENHERFSQAVAVWVNAYDTAEDIPLANNGEDPKSEAFDELVGLAGWMQESGRYAEAEEAYRAAIAIGHIAEHYLALGQILQETGCLEEALGAYRSAVYADLDLDDDDRAQLLDSLLRLGGDLLEIRQLNSAISAYFAAIKAFPDSSDAHAHLGHALLIKALDLDPGNEIAKRYLEYLKPASMEPPYSLGDFTEGIVGEFANIYKSATAENGPHDIAAASTLESNSVPVVASKPFKPDFGPPTKQGSATSEDFDLEEPDIDCYDDEGLLYREEGWESWEIHRPHPRSVQQVADAIEGGIQDRYRYGD